MIDVRRPTLRPLLGALLAALICLGASGAPPIEAREDGDNAAVAVNEQDGSSLFDVAFDIRRVSSGVVDQTNTAVAYASCESCQTVAIAIQIVLVSGTTDTVTPTNLAIAVNEECTSCQTLALAYQFVFGTGDVVTFTGEGNRRLQEIRRELGGLSKSGLRNDEISARVLDLTNQIRDVLATEVVVRGRGRRGPSGERDDRPTPPDPRRSTPVEPVPDDELAPPEDDQALPAEEETLEQPEEPAPPPSGPEETTPAPPAAEPAPESDSTAPTSP